MPIYHVSWPVLYHFTARCGQDEFMCGSGECIPQDAVCNSYPDCYDESDESDQMCFRELWPRNS